MSLRELIEQIAAKDAGLVEGTMPAGERLSRDELCAELGLDPAEVFGYAVMTYEKALRRYGRPHVAAAEVLLVGIELGRGLPPH